MRTMSVLFVLLVIVIVATGFYRGWFRVSGAHSTDNSHATLTVNQAKMRADKNAAVHDVKGLTSTSSPAAPTTSPDAKAP
ncbi:MAG: hypothetical protein HKL96_06955 [Phycisphaerales bacterium]|nr:hypothetical protein [Phycisphaerales bacterium]